MNQKIIINLELSESDIEDLMSSIINSEPVTHWVKKAEVVEPFLGDNAELHVAYGGLLQLTYLNAFDNMPTIQKKIDRYDLMHGLERMFKGGYDILTVENGKATVNFKKYDEVYADILLQFTVLGEVVYG